MRRLIATTLLLLAACDAPTSLEGDTNHPLTELATSATPIHGYWALYNWPTLVLDETGSCSEEAVEAALHPFHAAGIPLDYEPGACAPAHWHIEDGRICLSVDDDGLIERGVAGSASWRVRRGTTDEIVRASVSVRSECNPMVIAHEVGHVLGLSHSEDPTDTMWGVEGEALEFHGALEQLRAQRDVRMQAEQR